MVEGLITKQEKPSNTEVLGELINNENLPYITNLTHRNNKGLFKIGYYLRRLKDKKKSRVECIEETIRETLAYKCSVPKDKKGNRVDQIVDGLKHIIENENKDNVKSLAQQIKS